MHLEMQSAEPAVLIVGGKVEEHGDAPHLLAMLPMQCSRPTRLP